MSKVGRPRLSPEVVEARKLAREQEKAAKREARKLALEEARANKPPRQRAPRKYDHDYYEARKEKFIEHNRNYRHKRAERIKNIAELENRVKELEMAIKEQSAESTNQSS